MSYSAEILLGRISKINAFNGIVTVNLEKEISVKLKEKDPVFIEIEGKPVPFFISDIENPGAGFIRVKLRYYDSYEKLKGLPGCRVFLPGHAGSEGSFGTKLENPAGFKILDTAGTIIGTISHIIGNPAHPIAQVATPGNTELLIPFHEDLIVKYDLMKKTVIMKLPEGLEDINK